MVLFSDVKTTLERVLQNQIPIDYDDENYEYDDENGDNYDAYDDDNDQNPIITMTFRSK